MTDNDLLQPITIYILVTEMYYKLERRAIIMALMSLRDSFNSKIYTNAILEVMLNSAISYSYKMENGITTVIYY